MSGEPRRPRSGPIAEAAGICWIGRLSLTDFRSYAGVTLVPDGAPVVLAGANGIGKTNVLEALSLLAPGRGLRGAARRELERHGAAGGWAVAAELVDSHGRTRLGTGTTAAARDRRQFRLDGAPCGSADFLARLSVIWLTPAQDRLFQDAAGDRRRFLDRLVLASFPAHAGHVARYEAAARERMRLLTGERPADPAWLTALEAKMAEQAVAIAAARIDHLAALAAVLAAAPDGPFPRAHVALEGAVEAALERGETALAVEDWVRVRLADARTRDARSARASFGAARTDLMVTHAPKAMPAGLCSTGEQKALLLSLILAQAQLVGGQSGKNPIVLLEEVAAHLDADRRFGLFERIRQQGFQAWLTGTDAAVFTPLKGQAQAFTVDSGAFVPLRL